MRLTVPSVNNKKINKMVGWFAVSWKTGGRQPADPGVCTTFVEASCDTPGMMGPVSGKDC